MSTMQKSLEKEKPFLARERVHPLSADDVDRFLCACSEGCPRTRSLFTPSFTVPPQQESATRSLNYPNLTIPRRQPGEGSLCYPNLTIRRRRPGEALSLCGRACRANHSRMIATPPLPTYKHQMAGKSTLNRPPSDYKDQFWGNREAPVVPGVIVGGTSPEPENCFSCESICSKAEYTPTESEA
jgi:hypothetical protein